MQTNASTPVIDALGTLTTGRSLLVIAASLALVRALGTRRARQAA